jgi:LysM repeat protein
MKHKGLYLFGVIILLLAVCIPQNWVRAETTNIRYVVQRGDTLGTIAQKYCTTWRGIYNLNSATIGPDPNLIYAGMVLIIPANCSPGGNQPPSSGIYDRGSMLHAIGAFDAPYYTVARGDWLSMIGKRFGVPWRDIAAANDISGTTIYTGQVLSIPGAPGVTPSPEPSGTAERVRFAAGASSATRTGTISNGAPKTYVLRALAGQTMYVDGSSYGEALKVTITNSRGKSLELSGRNSRVNFNVQAYLPRTDNYYVTFTPVTQPERARLKFDVTFTIPALP